MKTKILHYTVIVEPDTETGTEKPGYSAYCPVLGVADDGGTIEEAIKNITKTIEFHLACLKKEGEEIPPSDATGSLVTSVRIPYPDQPSITP